MTKLSNDNDKALHWIALIEEELENANCHSFVETPTKLFKEIKKIVPLGYHEQLATIIYDRFYDAI